MKRKRIRLGDVYQIPLPNDTYAYARVMKDACIAVYKQVRKSYEDLPDQEEYRFIVGVYEDILKSGKWPVVDYRPFGDEDDAWPPPMCVIDKIAGKYSIYHKGQMVDASEEQCVGLEEAAVWKEEHIVDRIMGEDKWHKR